MYFPLTVRLFAVPRRVPERYFANLFLEGRNKNV